MSAKLLNENPWYIYQLFHSSIRHTKFSKGIWTRFLTDTCEHALAHMWMLYSSESAQHVECHLVWLVGQRKWDSAIGWMNEWVLNNNQTIRKAQTGGQISKRGCAATWTLYGHGQTCVTERERGGVCFVGDTEKPTTLLQTAGEWRNHKINVNTHTLTHTQNT